MSLLDTPAGAAVGAAGAAVGVAEGASVNAPQSSEGAGEEAPADAKSAHPPPSAAGEAGTAAAAPLLAEAKSAHR
jgi:hypothetical protein